jgi:division protein CdvB (Snf7/Vps24/ESCRT-III family)
MSPIIKIVNETKGQLKGVIPSIASTLQEINSELHGISESSKINRSVQMPNISPSSSEATRILEVAYLTAEEKLRSQFPKLPSDKVLENSIDSRILVTS